MRMVLVNATDSIIEERRRLGIDKQDECWEGEWHLVNPPKRWHHDLNGDLYAVLRPLAMARGLRAYPDGLGVFGTPGFNWRVPDHVYARMDQLIDDGVDGAELVAEFRSPGDETYEKFPFYASVGVREVLVVHEDRRFELYRLGAGGEYEEGGDTSAVLGVSFATVDGPRLRVAWEGGSSPGGSVEV